MSRVQPRDLVVGSLCTGVGCVGDVFPRGPSISLCCGREIRDRWLRPTLYSLPVWEGGPDLSPLT